MLEINQLKDVIKHLFQAKSYGKSLQDYVIAKNPKTTADIERLERDWQYSNFKGGQWL